MILLHSNTSKINLVSAIITYRNKTHVLINYNYRLRVFFCIILASVHTQPLRDFLNYTQTNSQHLVVQQTHRQNLTCPLLTRSPEGWFRLSAFLSVWTLRTRNCRLNHLLNRRGRFVYPQGPALYSRNQQGILKYFSFAVLHAKRERSKTEDWSVTALSPSYSLFFFKLCPSSAFSCSFL